MPALAEFDLSRYGLDEPVKTPERYEGEIDAIGMGAVTPLGLDLETSWYNLLNEHIGLDSDYQMPEFGTNIKVFGRVKADNRELEEVIKRYNIKDGKLLGDFRREIAHRSLQMGMVAMAEAMFKGQVLDQNGALRAQIDKNRIGFYIGTVLGGASDIGTDQQEVLKTGRADSRRLRTIDVNTLASGPTRLWGTHGPERSLITACAAGTQAIAMGAEEIRLGKVDIAVVGGTDSFVMRPIMSKYFEALETALSKEQNPHEALRAYDLNPTGTVISEGAGMIVLAREDMARKLGSKKIVKISGWGEASDGEDPFKPNGIGTAKTLELAIITAGLLTGLGYLNGHGGGTEGDATELDAILTALYKYGLKERTAINSTKPSTGHMWGGAGAFESIVAILALTNGILPPMMNSKNPLRDDVEFARNQSKVQESNWSGSTNTGLGGGTATVLWQRAA